MRPSIRPLTWPLADSKRRPSFHFHTMVQSSCAGTGAEATATAGAAGAAASDRSSAEGAGAGLVSDAGCDAARSASAPAATRVADILYLLVRTAGRRRAP